MNNILAPSISEAPINDLAISTTSSEEPPSTNGIQQETTLDSSTPHDTVSPPASNTAPSDLEDYRPQSNADLRSPIVTTARRRFFNRIITHCVLQLLMIETVAELFSNDSVYAQIPSTDLLRLMSLLKKSYQFAKRFNSDKELRMSLWRQGFMRQPPNLLKQESGSAGTYVGILMRMYGDEGEERRASRAEVEGALVP